MDSGTGGFIIMTPELHKPLIDYLFKHAGEANQALPKNFWHNNTCLPHKRIQFDKLPTLKLGLEGVDHSPTYLTLKPHTYINRAGCLKGLVRVALTSGLHPIHPDPAVKNHHLRNQLAIEPVIILGTSILNEYPMSIHFSDPATVSFYRREQLCK